MAGALGFLSNIIRAPRNWVSLPVWLASWTIAAISGFYLYVYEQICTILVWIFVKKVVKHAPFKLQFSDVMQFWWHVLAFGFFPFHCGSWLIQGAQEALYEGPCQWDVSRPYLGAWCWPDVEFSADWAVAHWDYQKTNHDYAATLSESMTDFLSSHLRYGVQTTQLREIVLEIVSLKGTDPLVEKLKNVTESSALAHNDLANQVEMYSATYCMGKDIINQELKLVFIAIAEAMSIDHQRRTWRSVFAYPWIDVLRILNKDVNHRLLPQPIVYTHHLEAQIRSLDTAFVQNVRMKIAEIRSARPTENYLSMRQVLGIALNTTGELVLKLEEEVQSQSWIRWLIVEENTDVRRRKAHALAEDLKTALRKLDGHTTSDFDFFERIDNHISLWSQNLLKPVSIRLPAIGNERLRDLSVYSPHMNPDDWISNFVGELCRSTSPVKTLSSELAVLCRRLVVGTISPEINGHNSKIFDRSWVMERDNVIRRIESELGTAVKENKDWALHLWEHSMGGAPSDANQIL